MIWQSWWNQMKKMQRWNKTEIKASMNLFFKGFISLTKIFISKAINKLAGIANENSLRINIGVKN